MLFQSFLSKRNWKLRTYCCGHALTRRDRRSFVEILEGKYFFSPCQNLSIQTAFFHWKHFYVPNPICNIHSSKHGCHLQKSTRCNKLVHWTSFKDSVGGTAPGWTSTLRQRAAQHLPDVPLSSQPATLTCSVRNLTLVEGCFAFHAATSEASASFLMLKGALRTWHMSLCLQHQCRWIQKMLKNMKNNISMARIIAWARGYTFMNMWPWSPHVRRKTLRHAGRSMSSQEESGSNCLGAIWSDASDLMHPRLPPHLFPCPNRQLDNRPADSDKAPVYRVQERRQQRPVLEWPEAQQRRQNSPHLPYS